MAPAEPAPEGCRRLAEYIGTNQADCSGGVVVWDCSGELVLEAGGCDVWARAVVRGPVEVTLPGGRRVVVEGCGA